MPEKPTYEELAQRVKELEHETLQAGMERDALFKSFELFSDKDVKTTPEISSPVLDIGSIINVEEIQSIMDDFYAITNMVTATLDLKGKVIEATGWQDICTKFHRINPETALNCTESDLFLARNLKPGEYVDYKCKNGLWDVVTPLYVGSRHLGNIYTGQFFYDDDEEVDDAFFIQQAEKYGFDKDSYLDAFRRIPRYNRETINHLMNFLIKFTTYISKIGLANILLEAQIFQRKQSEETLRESEEKFRNLFENSTIGKSLTELDGKVQVNNAFRNLVGYSNEELEKIKWMEITHPDDIQISTDTIKLLLDGNISIGRFEKRYIHKNGDIVWADVSTYLQRNKKGKPLFFITSVLDITERKRTEAALRESTAQYRLLADNVSDVIWTMDLNQRVTYVSPSVQKFLGYTPEESLQTPLKNILTPESYAKGVQVMTKAIARDGEPGVSPDVTLTLELEHIRKDSGTVWTEITTSFIRNEDGLPSGFIGITRDITERKRKELELRSAEAFLDSIINAIADPVFVKDDKRCFVLVNEAFCAIVGRPREDLIGKNDEGVFPEKEAKVFRKVDVSVLDTGKENVNEELLTNVSSGEERTIVTRKTRYTDPAGKRFLVGVVRDITERKRAEDELRKYELIVSSAKDLLALIDNNFVYLAANAAYLKAFGKTSDEIIGRTVADVLGEEFFNTVIRPKAELFLAGKDIHYQAWFEYPVFGRRYMDVSYSPYFGPDNEIRGFVATARDITKIENLQAQLAQAQKMESVGRLAGGVAHDYNNALSAIVGFTELSMADMALNDPLRENLDEVLKAAIRATDITRQLLTFARKQVIAPKVLYLKENVESILKMLRRLIGENVDLAWLPGANLWSVNMDPSQVDQLLLNLCINARDAIKDVGKITIETENVIFDASYCADHPDFIPGEFVLLAVSDNGCGMEKETLNNIFEPFFTTKAVDKGTGLGLATVYGIVKQNNGFINVYSEPEKGTTFRIYLPRHQGKVFEFQDKSPTEISHSRGETVLVVEDDLQILKLTRQILSGLGYNVLIAGTPIEAVGLVEEHAGEIHLLVTDVIMPEMNGRELSERLKASYPNIKSLFMSGYTANVIAHHGVLDEGVQFIQKPFSRRDLAVTVRKALDDK